jgi:dienelactone hydrolase
VQDGGVKNDIMPPVPGMSVPADLSLWTRQREVIRGTLGRLLGDLPARPAIGVGVGMGLAVRVVGVEEREGYTVERFEFDNGAGAVVPGVTVIPKGRGGRLPGILYCHWHGGEYDGGKRELFEAKHTPEVPAVALAARGYVVVAIDAYGFGERNGKGPGSEERGGAGEWSASKFNLWFGRTQWGMMLRDDLMALDYLASRADVDSGRLGVTGISMGATRSWWLMALDERLRAGVAVACMTRYQDLIRAGQLGAHGIYYFVPGMLQHFDTEAVIGLIAPRPVLFLTGDRDGGSPVAGIRALEEVVGGVYRLYGAEAAGHFESRVYEGVGHEYTADMWRRMLAWMDRHVGGVKG